MDFNESSVINKFNYLYILVIFKLNVCMLMPCEQCMTECESLKCEKKRVVLKIIPLLISIGQLFDKQHCKYFDHFTIKKIRLLKHNLDIRDNK